MAAPYVPMNILPFGYIPEKQKPTLGLDESGNSVPFTQPQFSFAVPQILRQLVSDLIASAKLPGQAAQGKLTDAQMQQGAAKFGVDVGLSGLGAPKPAGTLGTFGGKMARSANLGALADAVDMAARGADRGEIWGKTGWFQGPDSKWRFEINDSSSSYTPGKLLQEVISHGGSQEEIAKSGYQGLLSQVMQHEDMYGAYPEMKNTIWQSVPPARVGGFGGHQDGNVLRINDRFSRGLESGKSITLHEAQHRIQDLEDFARGGSYKLIPDEQINSIWNEYNDMDILTNEVVKKAEAAGALKNTGETLGSYIKKNPEVWREAHDDFRLAFGRPAETYGWAYNILHTPDQVLEKFFKASNDAKEKISELNWSNQLAKSNYMNLAGEAEARNVQARMHMTPSQRRATPPWETLDVPEKDAIVIGVKKY